MKMKPIAKTTVNKWAKEIARTASGQEGFEVISKLSQKFGFESCLVFEAIVSVVSISDENESGLQADRVQLLFSNHDRTLERAISSFFENVDPYDIPSAFEFYKPPFAPFATGTTWYRERVPDPDNDVIKTCDMLDQAFGPTGGVGFPIRSAQTDFSPAVCIVMIGRFSSDWLDRFLQSVVPSLTPVMTAFEEKLYPELIEAELKRVALTPRELECLAIIARGSNTKSAAYTMGISDTMVSRYLRQAQEKLRVCNTASAVLKAQKLGLVNL